MASVYRHQSRGWYVALMLPGRVRRQIYLGKVTKAQAEWIGRRLQELLAANIAGAPRDPETEKWLECCDPAFLAKLERAGLLGSWAKPEQAPLVIDYWEQYIDRRTDFAPGTARNWAANGVHIRAAFPNARMGEITIEDAKQFSRDLLTSGAAPSHVRQILNRIRQLHQAAIDAKLIVENPFADVRVSAKVNAAKRFHVTRDMALKIAEKFDCDQSRLVFLLARFCGLRIPHEALALTIDHVDAAAGRLTIPRATKTGHRVVPIFPEVRETLEQVWHAAPPGTVHLITRARNSATAVWRRWLEAAISDAGYEQWPDLWQNLRRSARTDLQERFPDHVCNAWLGHSSKIAAGHYLMVTDEHWTAANDVRRAPHGTAPDTARFMREEHPQE